MVTLAAAPTSLLSLRTVRAGLGLSRERMARLLDVSTRTVERWEARDELPSGRFALDQLAKLSQVVELGRAVYDESSFRRFVVTPLPAFDGRSALQLAEVGQTDRVLGALASLYEGQGL